MSSMSWIPHFSQQFQPLCFRNSPRFGPLVALVGWIGVIGSPWRQEACLRGVVGMGELVKVEPDDRESRRRKMSWCLSLYHFGIPWFSPRDIWVALSSGISCLYLQPSWVKAQVPSWIHLSQYTFCLRSDVGAGLLLAATIESICVCDMSAIGML